MNTQTNISKYVVYMIKDKGEGRVEKLWEWDGETEMRIDTGFFGKDVIISIEPLGENYD